MGELKLPRLISDGMVLQQKKKARIWGEDKPGRKVTVSCFGEEYATETDADGYWEVFIEEKEAGVFSEMIIKDDAGEEKNVKDIAVGDVFLCAGQSNMELPIARVRDYYPEEAETCENADIRTFKITECRDFHAPLKELESGEWKAVDNNTFPDFSATAYFFAKHLYRLTKTPIGLINASLGGSRIESWMGRDMLKGYDDFLAVADRYSDDDFVKERLAQNERQAAEWHVRLDEADIGVKENWQQAQMDVSDWNEVEIPFFFKDTQLKGFIGSVWFYKEFIVGEQMAGKEAKLWLGTIVDSDTVYVNGVLTGHTDYQYPPRKYTVPEGVLREGKNVIVIRVKSEIGQGRFTDDKPYALFRGDDRVKLSGKWRYRIGASCEMIPATDFISWKPTGLYHGMVAPCHKYALAGILWYQGESNTHETANRYFDLMKRMVAGYREKWEDELPFIYVQLPNFQVERYDADRDDTICDWPYVREAQRKALEIPKTAMVTAIDVGEDNDLHPLRKEDIGYRLAMQTAKMLYGKESECAGPQLEAVHIEQDGGNGGNDRRFHKAVLTFTQASGMYAKTSGIYANTLAIYAKGSDMAKSASEIRDFELMDEQGGLHTALAEISGNQVILTCPEKIAAVREIRYCYHSISQGALLYNEEEFPMTPFRLEMNRTDGRYLWNDGWSFLETPPGTSYEQAVAEGEKFEAVDIPHDWLIYDSTDLYRDGTGWYRKCFDWWESAEEKNVFLTFDGVYMDSRVYVNGQTAGEWKYGYSAFTLDITDFLRNGKNEIVVSVCFRSPNSRWYSGAGIYRNVWLSVTGKTYLPENAVYISVKKEEGQDFRLHLESEIKGERSKEASLCYTLLDDNGREVDMLPVQGEYEDAGKRVCEFMIKDVRLWDVDTPVLYTLRTELFIECRMVQSREDKFGFRYTKFHPEYGFFLNGRNLKLNGVCEHHDLGALGAAFHKSAMRRKFRILKEMGVNAVRGSHNMMAPEFMELADEMGILLISEAFDMWERSKTPYDYARFFKEWSVRDVESWIKTDRNHPSVIMWSIGNEIYDTHADGHGQEIARYLKETVEKYDARHNAAVTIASNYMPWENAQKCADIVKLAGYNYSEKYYEEHHGKHPDWVIYGSETSSIVQSRGVYHFPLSAGILSEDDEQCSALGNSPTSWGARSMEKCATMDRDMPFSMGQFLWTGFDYIGEPTPYHTKNSYFGQVDTAGFAKDSYYVWQSVWTDYKKAPMVHIFPYWDFNEGQLIDVRVCSNAPWVELLLNGKSLGRQRLDHEPGSGSHIIADYQVLYEPGVLTAFAYDEEDRVVARTERHSFGNSAKLMLTAEKSRIKADGKDLLFVTVTALDKDGNPVENACDRVLIQVTGAGRLIGLDNGDSTDYDSYKGISRRMFSGKLLAIIQAAPVPGEIRVEASAKNLESASLCCAAVQEEAQTCLGEAGGITYPVEENKERSIVCGKADEAPVRKIVLSSPQGCAFSPQKDTITAKALIEPPYADDKELTFKAVNDTGVPVSFVQLTQNGNRVTMKAKGDGEFRLFAVSKSGTEKVRVMSQLTYTIAGIGQAYKNPYDFLSASLYDEVKGEVGNGNERGIATGRDGETCVTYHDIDFGEVGSDEITIPVFALNDDEYTIRIWEGVPKEAGSTLLADVIYQKPSRWNVYQPETYRLSKRLKGITSLGFQVFAKVHIKGFSFTRYEKAWLEMAAQDADAIYGDSFTKTQDAVEEIGNNVSLIFTGMDFADIAASRIAVCGRAKKGSNTIHIRFNNGTEEIKQIVEFPESEEYILQQFALEPVSGKWDVSFVFLPGSYFDFRSFRFIP